MANPNIQNTIVGLRDSARRSRYIAAGCAAVLAGNATSIATGIIYNGGNRLTVLGMGVAGGMGAYQALRSIDLSGRATAYETAMLATDPESVSIEVPPSIFEKEVVVTRREPRA